MSNMDRLDLKSMQTRRDGLVPSFEARRLRQEHKGMTIEEYNELYGLPKGTPAPEWWTE